MTITSFAGETVVCGFDSSAPLTEGILRCSRKIPGGMGFLPDPSLDSISAAVFLSLGTYRTLYPTKHFAKSSTSSLYAAITEFLACQVPATCCATRSESPQHTMCLTPISIAMRSPCSKASYSAMLFVHLKWICSTYCSSSQVGDL